MKDFVVPYVPVSDERLAQLSATMASGAGVLLQMQTAMKKALGVKQISRRKVVGAILKGKRVIFGVKASGFNIDAIRAVKAVEWEILSSISALMQREIRRFRNAIHNTAIMSIDDITSEALCAATDSIYYFNGTTKFTTFVTHAIRKRIRAFLNSNDNLSGISPAVKRLAVRFEKIKRGMNGPASDMEVMETMNLSEREKESLSMMLKTVTHETAIVKDEEAIHDFTVLAKPKEVVTLDPDQVAAIQNAKLTPVELDVLRHFLAAPFGSNGWKTAVAKLHKNPVTGKAYTRAAPSLIMRRVREKVLHAYKAA